MHQEAQLQRRSTSGYVLRIVMVVVEFEEKLVARFYRQSADVSVWAHPIKAAGARTTFLLRCSEDESKRIRAAAKRRDASLSGYVLRTLGRAWAANGCWKDALDSRKVAS